MTEEWMKRMKQYEDAINERVELVKESSLNVSEAPHWNRLSMDEYDKDFVAAYNEKISDDSIKGADEQDGYINMEVGLSRGPDGELENAIVKKRAVDVDDVPIGKANVNPIMDTRRYKVEYEDGTKEILPANILAENILSQVDEDGHKQLLFEEIIDHRSNSDAIKCEDGHVTNPINGYKHKKRTTKGWDLCVQWKGGNTSWVAFKDMKHGFPIQVARYAIKHGIDKELTFH